jgi:uncharacterized membrane protein
MSLKYKTFVLLAAAGIVVAAYHAYSELAQVFTFCNVNVHVSCGLVFQTGYTTIVINKTAVPFWLLGVIWFPLILLLGIILWNRSRLLLIPILLIGDMFTIYLWYVEIEKVWPAAHALCPVCVSLYVINYVLTVIAAISIDFA